MKIADHAVLRDNWSIPLGQTFLCNSHFYSASSYFASKSTVVAPSVRVGFLA